MVGPNSWVALRLVCSSTARQEKPACSLNRATDSVPDDDSKLLVREPDRLDKAPVQHALTQFDTILAAKPEGKHSRRRQVGEQGTAYWLLRRATSVSSVNLEKSCRAEKLTIRFAIVRTQTLESASIRGDRSPNLLIPPQPRFYSNPKSSGNTPPHPGRQPESTTRVHPIARAPCSRLGAPAA